MNDDLEKMSKTELIEIITQHKTEHEFLQNVIDSMSDTVMVVRNDTSVSLMDKTVRFKLKNAKIKDKENPKCYEIYHNKETQCASIDNSCPLSNVLETQKKTTILHKQIDNKGKISYLELVGTPILDKNKNIIGIVESTRDVTSHIKLLEELQEKSALLTFQASHDCLTELPNRTLFMDRLQEGMKEARREKTKLALLFLDLDNFKDVNDMYGHKAGDAVLKEMAKYLTSLLRETDTLSRLGGDEFTIIMKGVQSKEDTAVLAQKIIGILNSISFEFEEHTIDFSCSIGVCIFNGAKDTYSKDTLISNADKAMYKAKKLGKNSVEYHY